MADDTSRDLAGLFKAKYIEYGSQVSFTAGGTTYQEYWQLEMCNASEVKNYLDDIEAMAVIKPCYKVEAPSDSHIAENITFTYNDRVLTARKIFKVNHKNTCVYIKFIAY